MLPLLIAASAADTLTPDTLPASGHHHAAISVDAFGRYAILADSEQGVALQLVDRMAGPIDRSGQAGIRDGRRDVFLSQGEYRLRTEGAERADGEANLTLRPFEELNPDPLGLSTPRTVETTLADFQQRSYWIELETRQQVDLEAAGRALVDLRLWREGAWLVDANPHCTVVTPEVGRPLNDCTLSLILEAGLYRVSAYGGIGLDWANDDGSAPLIVRRGIADLGRAGQLQTTISPLGIDRWRVSSSWVQLALPRPEAAHLSIRNAGNNPYQTGGTTRQITTKSEKPVVSALLRGTGERIVTVRGKSGQSYSLQHFTPTNSAASLTPSDAPVFVSTIHSGVPEDILDATGLILRQDKEGVLVSASGAIPLTEDARYQHRFNLSAAATLLLEVTTAGTWNVAGSGVDTRFQIVPLVLNPTPERPEPITFRSDKDLDLNPGFYQLTLQPDESGILDLTIRPSRAAGILLPLSASLQFPSVILDKAGQHSLLFSSQSGVRVGVIQRTLPLDLREPMPLSLAPGQTLTLEAQITGDGALQVIGLESVGVWIDGWEADPAGSSVTRGLRKIRLRNDGQNTAQLTIKHTPASMVGGLPLISLDNMPDFPDLTAADPLFLDLERDDRATVSVQVAEPALYVLESTGLLALAGAVRTQTLTRLDEGRLNGAGRNFRIEQYLREGEYQLTVSTQGRSAGHLGVQLTQAPLRDGGVVDPGIDARIALTSGEGVVYTLNIPETGVYDVEVVAEGSTPRCRLETTDGWPLRTPGQAADFSHRFEAGEYRLTLLPGSVNTRLVTSLSRPAPAPHREGHGPHILPLDEAISATWLEPRVEEDTIPERTPDRWTFDLAAPAQTTIHLSKEMLGILSSGDEILLQTTPGRTWSGTLPAGSYHLDVRSVRRNHGARYGLTIATTELTAGRSRSCTAPCTIPVAVGGSGLVELSSIGRSDVRARLYDADGTLVALSDDRPGGWNFQILSRLNPGTHHLQVDPVGARSARVTIAMRQPAEPVLAAFTAPGQTTLIPGIDALLVPLTTATDGTLIIHASAEENVGIALEAEIEGVWQVLGEAGGPNARLAVPAVPVAAARCGEGVAEAASLVQSAYVLGEPSSGRDADWARCKAVVADRLVLSDDAWRRLAVRGDPATWKLPRARGATLVIARANSGQPGLSLDGVTGTVSHQAAAAVSLDEDPPTLRRWSGDKASRLTARVRAWRFDLSRAQDVTWGATDLSAAAGAATRWTLPEGELTLRLSLQAGTVAAVVDRDGRVHVRHADGAAQEALLWGELSEVVLLNPTDGDAFARLEVLPSRLPAPALTPRAPLERQDSRTGLLRVAVPEVGGDWSVMLRGAIESATWIGDDGRIRWAEDGAVDIDGGGGELALRTGAGTAVAWMTGPDGDGLWSHSGAAIGAPLHPPTAQPLSGSEQAFALDLDAPALLHLHLDAPVVLALRSTAVPTKTVLLPEGGSLSAMLPAGGSTLALRGIGGSVLSGQLTARLDTPTPIGEGLGPSVLLSAGEQRWFSFSIPDERTIGAGVRAGSDRVHARLMDAAGTILSEGTVMMEDLPAGDYLLALLLPADAPPSQARPVLAGIEPPDQGPPDAVIRRYQEAAQ